MATIRARKRRDGSTAYCAMIRIKRKGSIIHAETRTFSRKRMAQEWAARRELELEDPRTLAGLQHQGVSVGQVLQWYRDDFDGDTAFGRSKLSNINALIKDSRLSDLDAMELTSGQVMSFVRARRQDGAGPSTVNNDLIWLRGSFRSARIGRDIPLSLQVIDDAVHLARQERMVSRSKQRSRRPSLSELDRLLSFFASRDGRAQIPMVDIVLFALFSSRRQEEICRIRWDDLDSNGQRILVRELKHPRSKNDTWVALPDRAMALIQRQAKTGDRIFPFNGKSVGSSFTKACKFLGIDDLHFHDLRHECASWLFELGWDIPRVAQVTGHRTWSALQGYTHLQGLEVADRYEGWNWAPL